MTRRRDDKTRSIPDSRRPTAGADAPTAPSDAESAERPLRDAQATSRATGRVFDGDTDAEAARAVWAPPEGGTLAAFISQSRIPPLVHLRAVAGQPNVSVGEDNISGRYAIGPELGRGGMGYVSLVRDLDLGRQVALKTIDPADPDAEALSTALICEARMTGQLEHPNIMPVYELGGLDVGKPFYTMKAVAGPTLKDVLDGLRAKDPRLQKEYPLRHLIAILSQICQALHYAHSRGVVHRDLKPDNILLGAFGEVLVMDWGISHFVDDASAGLFSADGIVVGTPHYMAPEQARGDNDGLDGRSDIFALGVMLYEILTLELPIMEPEADKVLEMLRTPRVPPYPRATDPRRPVPGILADACVRAMACDKEDRFPTAGALHQRLQAFLEGSEEEERRVRMAGEALSIGMQALGQYGKSHDDRTRLAARIAEREREVHRWDAQEAKRALHELNSECDQLEFDVSQAFSRATNSFHRVLALVPDHKQARAALARLYWDRFCASEREHDHANMIYFGNLVLRFNDPDGRGPLVGGAGRLTVRSFPEGAEVLLYDYQEGGIAQRMERVRRLGKAPVALDLPIGCYLLVAHKDGYRDAQQPLFIRPGQEAKYLLTLNPWDADEGLIGRDEELATLRFNLRRAVEGRQVRRVLVTGQDGIGKSRVLSAFNDLLDRVDHVLLYFFAECHERHMLVPWGAFTECLRIRAGVEPNDSENRVRHKVFETIISAIQYARQPTEEERALADRTARQLARLPGLVTSTELAAQAQPREMRERFDRAIGEFVRLITRGSPAVFIFQGVEYLDDASSRVLVASAAQMPDTPILVLGLGTDVSVTPAWDEVIQLGPLRESAVDAMLRELLKRPIPPDLLDYTMARTAGIPWLVVDTVRRLIQGGLLQSADGRWHLTARLPRPGAVGMVEARRQVVRDLPDRLRAALRVAATTGDVFWAETLEALNVANARAACDELVAREIVRELPSSRYDGTRAFVFRSVLFREIVYDSIDDPAELAGIHLAVADWVRERFQGQIREVAELAWHVEQARDEAWAAMLWAQLGDACRDHGCFGMARECYVRALTNTTDGEDRARLEERLAAVQRGLRDHR